MGITITTGGGGTSSGGGSSSSGGSSGSSDPSGAKNHEKARDTGAFNWNQLSKQEKRNMWGTVNEVYQQIYGRGATMKEAQKWYREGIGTYALQQKLYMSKEFLHTALYHQQADSYNAFLQQYLPGFHLKAKQIQAFAAHGYTQTDVQNWVQSKPNLYVHTNEYHGNVASLLSTYQQVTGINPYIQQSTAERAVRVDTNKKQPGMQGHKFTEQVYNPILQHVRAAALHFNTPDEYAAWLQQQPGLNLNAHQTQVKPSDAGLNISPGAAPVQTGNPVAREVAASGDVAA